MALAFFTLETSSVNLFLAKAIEMSNKSGDYSAVVVSGVNLEIPETLLYDNNLWKDVSFLMIQNEIKEEMNLAAAKEAKKRNIKVFFNAAPAKKINHQLFLSLIHI